MAAAAASRTPRPAVRGLAWSGAVVFAAFAAVQVNDPDPARWIAIHAAAAGVCAAASFGPLRWPIPAVVAAVALPWAASLAPAAAAARASAIFEGAGMMAPGVEEVREMLGLLIVSAAMVACLRQSRGDA